MKVITLTQGKEAFIDDEDYDRITEWKWCFNKKKGAGYAVGKIGDKCEKRLVLMHQFIMNFPAPPLEVDHIDGNMLNNQKSNLRLATRSEQEINKGRKTEKYKGVTKLRNGRWKAQFRVNGVMEYIGEYATDEEAARAYDNVFRLKIGEGQGLNFPPEVST